MAKQQEDEMAKQQSKVDLYYTKDDALQTLQSIQSWISAMDVKASYNRLACQI